MPLTKQDVPRMRKIAEQYDRDAERAEHDGDTPFHVFAIRHVANNWRRHADALEAGLPQPKTEPASDLWNRQKTLTGGDQ